MSEKHSFSVIGRTKCVIVFDSGGNTVGIVSDVVVRVLPDAKPDRLSLCGPVKFNDSNRQHLISFVLSVVDRVTDILNVPRKNYEVSIVNPGATSLIGIGVEVSGFSADLPILIALISASLQMPLKQGVVSTGHVASIDGDLVCVRGIQAKLEAALASVEISEFVVPDLDKEGSPKVLTPIEYKAAMESLIRHKDDINIHSADNILDAFKIFFKDEAIVFGGLKSGFFYQKSTETEPQSFTGKILDFFVRNNEKRFWDVLEYAFLDLDLEKALLLLLAYVEFHVQNKRYPDSFGEQLFSLVVSLPPASRKLDALFPLFPMELCIQLTQYATKNDHDDVRKLYRTVFGEGFDRVPYASELSESISFCENDNEEKLIDWLLKELSQENLAKKVGLSLDMARGRYVMDKISVKDGFEFNEALTGFYCHMLRHSGSHKAHMDKSALTAEAIDLVKKAFSKKGDYNAALSEGKYATNGGMRMVFDAMTDYLKINGREKYITRIFKDTIDPLNWNAKVKLMEAFMKRIKHELPDDLKDLSTKQLAHHWESIIQYYSESMSNVSDLLKTL